MSAFDTAWDLVKDFYFAPPHDLYGLFEPNNGLSSFFQDEQMLRWMKGEGIQEPQGFNEEKKREWMPTPTEPFSRGGSLITPNNRLTGTVGVNLAGV